MCDVIHVPIQMRSYGKNLCNKKTLFLTQNMYVCV